jgi:hypothetical protein
MEEMAAGRLYADHGPEEFGITGDQLGREETAGDEARLAVDVGNDLFEQFCALLETLGDLVPVGFVDDQRDVGKRPGALLALGAVVFAVEYAGVPKVLVGALEAGG